MTNDNKTAGDDYEVSEDHPDKRYDRERTRTHEEHPPEGRRREQSRRISVGEKEVKGGEDYEMTEEHPQRRYDDEPAGAEPRARVEYRESDSDKTSDTSSKVSAGGSTVGALAGAGAIVLAILGIIGILPFTMLAISTIVVGGGMMLAGLTISASMGQAIQDAGGDASDYAAVGGGLSTEVVGGATGVVLGILALLGTSPMVLIPAAVIALGAADFFGAGATSQLQSVSMRQGGHPGASQGMAGASGTKAFIGIGVTALGILALAGMSPMTLSLISFIALGTSMLVSGAALGGGMVKGFSA